MRLLHVVLLLCMSCLASFAQVPQTTPPKPPSKPDEVSEGDVLRVNTTLVGVPVTVLDRDGRFVRNLTKEDFHVYEDGVEQKIAYFAPVETRVSVLLLFDHFVRNYQEVALAFAEQLQTGDKVIVARFGDMTYETLTRVDDGRAAVGRDKQRVKWQFGKNVHDAVDAAVRRMNGIQGRKAILLFSDGMSQGVEKTTYRLGPDGKFDIFVDEHYLPPPERATMESTLNEAEESDAPIYVLRYDSDTMGEAVRNGPTPGKKYEQGLRIWLTRMHNEYKIAGEYLHALAEKSGGRLFPVMLKAPINKGDKIPDLTQPFTQIVGELREQYSLGYYPQQTDAAKARHEIKVHVDKPGVAVRSRTSYVPVPAKP